MLNTDYTVRNEIVSTDQASPEIRCMICQFVKDELDWEEVDDLLMIRNTSKLRNQIVAFTDVAKSNGVDVMIFPECSIPESLVEDLYKFAAANDMYIIAGTHYKKSGPAYTSICPVITPQKVYEIEKINVSPFEDSPYPNKGFKGGRSTAIFRNSRIGTFAVTVCIDFMNDELKGKLGLNDLQLLFVPSFNNTTDNFYERMDINVNDSRMGMYILYANMKAENSADGRSAIFGQMYTDMRNKLVKTGATDERPQNLLYRLKDDQRYVIFSLDMQMRKPTRARNIYSGCNFKIVKEDIAEDKEIYKFLKCIKVIDDKYQRIDSYYVLPDEYDEIRQLLDEKNVVVILGDPGIGKTYTAVHLLHEYYKKGYKPRWFFGLDKDEREIQAQELQKYEPDENEIVYFEDPFGHTKFERREELAQIFKPLLSKVKASGSKMIITSRSAVFEKFKEETLDADSLKAYSKEMGIMKPSYSPEKLKEMATRYMDSLTSWDEKSELRAVVLDAVSRKQLITPLAIYNAININRRLNDKDALEKSIKEVRGDDMTVQFSFEISNMSIPKKVLLYLIFFLNNKHVRYYQKLYEETLYKLRNRLGDFELTHYSTELNDLTGVIIQRIGDECPAFRFSHSLYEEVMAKLFLNDKVCKTIGKEAFSQIYEINNGLGVLVLNLMIVKYPQQALEVYRHVQLVYGTQLKDYQLLRLVKKMLFSTIPEFVEESKNLLKIEELLDALYTTDNLKDLFYEMVRMLIFRYGEAVKKKIKIEWDRIFTAERILKFNPVVFINCLVMVGKCESNVVKEIVDKLKQFDIWRIYLLTPTEHDRVRFNKLLTGTIHENVYNQLLERVPNIDDLEHGQFKYFNILKEYVFDKQPVKGVITIDKGAYNAMRRGARLFPVGILNVSGVFDYGDLVQIESSGRDAFISIVEASSEFLRDNMGKRTDVIMELSQTTQIPVVSRKKYRYRKVNS